MRARHLIAALGTSALLALGSLVPAHATGGPPVLSPVTPSPVAADGTLTVAGTGCDAGSAISFTVWDTSGGTRAYHHHTTLGDWIGTGWTADGGGAFTRAIPLENRFAAGAEIGIAATCTTTFPGDGAGSSVPAFVLVALPDPVVDISAPTQARYGAVTKVRVTTSDASGWISLSVPGHADQGQGSTWGPVDFTLPRTLGLGSHVVTATFDPTVDGAPTVTDTATITIIKATSKATLSKLSTKKVKVGKKVKLKVVLSSTGKRTGKVVIKDGKKNRYAFWLRAGDNGKKTIWVKMPTKGTRYLTAKFVGNSVTKSSTSKKVKVQVKK